MRTRLLAALFWIPLASLPASAQDDVGLVLVPVVDPAAESRRSTGS